MTVRLTPARRKWLEHIRDAERDGEPVYSFDVWLNVLPKLREAGWVTVDGHGPWVKLTPAGIAALEQDTPK